MKNVYLICSLVLSLFMGMTIDSYSQYYLAGQYNAGSYFFNLIPDSTIVGPNNHGPGPPPASYRIDIDGNGVDDFYLQSYGEWANGFGNSHIVIKSYALNNQIAFGHNDTCHTPNSTYFLCAIAKSFNKDDTINTSPVWSNDLYLTYSGWALMAFSCTHNGFISDSRGNYIGVRIIKPSDTIYGWIKITNVDFLSFTVQEFACDHNSSGINEKSDIVKIYPIPTNGKISIETTIPDFDYTVYNQYGVEIVARKHNPRKSQIDLFNKANGVYFVKIIKDKNVIMRKIIKQ